MKLGGSDMITDLRTQIMATFNAPLVEMHDSVDRERLADLLVALFNQLDEYRCDFDCDNCHAGGCGNPLCDRMGCPEENAAQAAWDSK